VLQEVFKTVAWKIHTFHRNGTPGAFRGWLKRITEFKVREYWGRAKDEPPAPGGSSAQARLGEIPAEQSHSDTIVSERVLLLRRALELTRDQFESRTWEAVWEVVVEGRGAQEVAEQFGMKVGTLHVYKSRVLRCLRSEFDGLIDDQGDR
jgi:DNA-directed RNA polymerase specialized sigma24 family protein